MAMPGGGERDECLGREGLMPRRDEERRRRERESVTDEEGEEGGQGWRTKSGVEKWTG